ncbi:glycoside hydrolase 5 family protein [Paracraurococcus lichenis]|uniref:mannan endo-1,4-beta-mannosidase n=1 Tax=Paracraurococcus lichenis TaxID=3064888 RepID=A0ABT9E2L8_9PROT|nr:cellulase family glycosylhydrolase [Paracraurococcus sp. LOR1-02]MDO9710386.1 cellulase family glycosylhydrolase [Paracraurococcus sp. LOR1-02]
MRSILASILLLCLALLPGRAAAPDVVPRSPRAGFVGVDGTQFVLDGKPFRVAGVNNHYLTYGSDQEVLRMLDDAVALGANTVRTFLQPVIGSIDGTVPTIWDFQSKSETSNLGVNGRYMLYWDPTRGGMAINWGENGIGRFDMLVAEAKKRNLRLIVAFLDFWAFTGGAQQMRAWYGSDDKHRFFFEDPRTRADYRRWVREIVEHVNPHTGLAYRDEPTIMAWNLMNEPEAKPERLQESWISDMAAYVRSIAPNQLITSGQANVVNRLSDVADPHLDFAVWHGYPLYYRLTPAQFDDRIRDFCALGQQQNKPVLLEEFGYARSHPDQAQVYANWLRTIRDTPGCAGWLIWRLVSRQDHGGYPKDEHDQFDIHNDGGSTWDVLRKAATERHQGADAK